MFWYPNSNQNTMAAASLLLLFILSFAACAAADDSKIPIPSSLSPASNSSSVWLSPSGIFAFGFYKPPKGYAVCIFYTAFSDRPVVWTAADNFNPILPRNVFSLEINSNGIQILQHEGGKTFIYQQIASPEEDIAWASMLDNGNFVLYNSFGDAIWQSFDHPTDTLLPGQYLPPGGELVSRASETDLRRGMFRKVNKALMFSSGSATDDKCVPLRLKMQFDGNLVQYPVSTPDIAEHAYFATHTVGIEENAFLYLDKDGSLRFQLQTVKGKLSLSGIVYRASIDSDGIFRLWSNRQGNWTSTWSSVDDQCEVKGICGVNSFCSFDQDQAVSCKCLPGFSNSTAGCSEDYSVNDCRNRNPEVEYEITRLPNVTWTTNNDHIFLYDAGSEQDCGHACLNDCNCVVALFQDGDCFRQTLPLRYGRRSISASGVALVRITSLHTPSPPVFTAPNGSGSGQMLPARHGNGISHLHLFQIIIKGVSIVVAFLVISTFIIYYLIKQRRFGSRGEESTQNVNKLVLSHGSLAPTRYSYNEIRKITKFFTEKLGQGGYGIVYKGMLPDGQLVAVKVLRETHNSAEEFVNEVASISRTSHVNIVNLLGFCFERKKRALIYQFMPNKSLDKFIYKNGNTMDAECSLEWNKLYEIALGVARGLEYLHRGCNTRIVHFDIKPQNILLDEEFCPKISDFGLAKLCMKKQSVISMLGTRGTVGYIAPEVFSRNFGVVSHKSDVYSYGIMLLQMVEARANVEVKTFETNEVCYLEKIYNHVLVQNEKIYGLVREEEEKAMLRMLMVGFWCIQTTPSSRPPMNNVMDLLQGNLQSIPIPPLPFLLCSPKPQLSRTISL